MRCFRSVRKEQGEISSEINSSLQGIQLTKAFDNEEYEINNFKYINDRYKNSRLRQVKEIGFFHSSMNYLINITNLILLVSGGIMFINGDIDAADLTMFFLYVNFLVSPITKLSNTVETTQNAWSGFERFYNIMKIENKIKSKDNAIRVDSFKGKIEFKNVYFKYKDESEEVLNNFNLVIEPSKKIALIGETGVGKSTISKIIPRFYEVNDGEILIDDINIKEYELNDLRRQIGHVQQDVFIFFGTIKDNILYGNPSSSMEEVIEASKKANIYDFIMSLKDGFDTICGERGIQLSGGQKQRISIARIFLKNPNILILDEATSALDNVTEKMIQKSFDELAKGKTTIMIAHRLTTIQDADEIIVLGKEGIIEKGSHDELMSINGTYSKMYKNGQNLEN
jgi:ATP-binding cassette subfamily B protein